MLLNYSLNLSVKLHLPAAAVVDDDVAAVDAADGPLELLALCEEKEIISKLNESHFSSIYQISSILSMHTLNQILASLLCDHGDLLICIGTILGMNTLVMIQQCQM